jgi:hypothetical protein
MFVGFISKESKVYANMPINKPKMKTSVNVSSLSQSSVSYVQSRDGPMEAYVKQTTTGSSKINKEMGVNQSRTVNDFFDPSEIGDAYFPQILKYKETGP